MNIKEYLDTQINEISDNIFTGYKFSAKIQQIAYKLIHDKEGIDLLSIRTDRSIKRFLEELIPLEALV